MSCWGVETPANRSSLVIEIRDFGPPLAPGPALKPSPPPRPSGTGDDGPGPVRHWALIVYFLSDFPLYFLWYGKKQWSVDVRSSSRRKVWSSRFGRRVPAGTFGQSPRGGTRDRRDPYSSHPRLLFSLSLQRTRFSTSFNPCDVVSVVLLSAGYRGSTTKLNWTAPQHRVIKSKPKVYKAGDLRNDEIESGYRKDAPRDPQCEEGRNRTEVHVLSCPARVRLSPISSEFWTGCVVCI